MTYVQLSPVHATHQSSSHKRRPWIEEVHDGLMALGSGSAPRVVAREGFQTLDVGSNAVDPGLALSQPDQPASDSARAGNGTEDATDADGNLEMIIGGAAAASVILLLAVVYIGYWLVKRRARRRDQGQPRSAPKLEAPRKAGRKSIALSLDSAATLRASPPRVSKDLPEPPSPEISSANLLSSRAFAITPVTTAFPIYPSATHWHDPEKSPVDESSYDYGRESVLRPVSALGTPRRSPRLTVVSLLPEKRPSSIDVELGRGEVLAQAVDSVVREAAKEVVPPYTPR